MFMIVDFPEPEGPMMAINSPGWTFRETSERTVMSTPPMR
jgi:hypothetical protein